MNERQNPIINFYNETKWCNDDALKWELKSVAYLVEINDVTS